MSKKKDQDKFNQYSVNTDDAWEIDDRKMTLKILDNDEDDDLGISKQIQDLASKGVQQHKPNGNNRIYLAKFILYSSSKTISRYW
jgi:hypothetical protein